MSQPPSSSPSRNSCGIVGQFEIAESSWRIRGSGRMSTAANGVLELLQHRDRARGEAAGGRLGGALHEQDHLVLGERLGDRLADRVGLLARRRCGGLGGARHHRQGLGLAGHGGSWLSQWVWICEGVCVFSASAWIAAADFRAEDRVDEAVLLDPAEPVERRRGDRRAEVIAAAGVVLDVGLRAVDRGLDALLYVLGGGHLAPSVEDRRSRPGEPAPSLYFGKSWSRQQERAR